MKIHEKPAEVAGNPCPSCGNWPAHEPPVPDLDSSALALLESENSGLRRLVVELLEKNQSLREQLEAATLARSTISSEESTSHRQNGAPGPLLRVV
jgi:hypothetical protein